MPTSVATDTVNARHSKSEQAYAWIQTRIARHEFGPGYRLVLGSIADELGMSVVPVREAIRRLEAEGLVTFERNVGARVTLVDAAEYVDTMESLGIIEGAATALAAPLLTTAALDRAEAVNERMSLMLTHFDAHAFTVHNQEFHSILFEACPNAHLIELVRRDWARLANLRDSTFTFVPNRARHSVAEHAEILQLIRSGAPAADIELAAREHRWHTLQAYREARASTERHQEES